MAVRAERGQHANTKAFTRAAQARPTTAMSLGVTISGAVSTFMAQPQPEVITARYELIDKIALLSADIRIDPHKVYGLMGGASETAAPPTSSVSLAETPSRITLFNKITSNIKTDLQTTMVLFSMDEHAMAYKAS